MESFIDNQENLQKRQNLTPSHVSVTKKKQLNVFSIISYLWELFLVPQECFFFFLIGLPSFHRLVWPIDSIPVYGC